METSGKISLIEILLPLAGLVFIIAAGVVLLVQQFHKNLYRQKLQQEEMKNLHQAALLKVSITVQEKERKRIAQDLHDELGANLSIARMLLMQVEQQSDPAQQASLARLKNLAENALVSMRRISHELMPPQLESFGLVKTLQAVATNLSETDNIALDLQVPQGLPPLGWAIDLGLYRILMELLNNTLKHAEASTIAISLFIQEQQLVCTYRDNGKGMVLGESVGMGLKNIEGRAQALGGTVQFKETNQQGFYAVITIPC